MIRRSLIATVMILAGTVSVSGQVVVQGSLDAYAYAFETVEQSSQLDFYQALRVRAWLKDAPTLRLNGSMRVARRGDPADWEGRLYNGYLQWRPDPHAQVRVGRQFLYSGVIRGTADAVSVDVDPADRLTVRLVAGLEPPLRRDFELGSTDDGNVLGAYGSGQLSKSAKIDASYFQRVRSDALVWQLAGVSLSGEATPGLFYLAQLDYNLKSSDYHRMRYRLTYSTHSWTFSGEFQSQKPEVLEDSYFNIFELNAYNQFRVAGFYRFGAYQVGLQNYVTLYEEGETGNEVLATFASRWGTVGVVYQSGFGGDRVGLYGEVRYEVAPGLEARGQSSYYNFQRYTADFDEDATSFSAGLRYRPVPRLMIDAEVQESLNSLYDNDLRGLFRVSYSFSTL